LIIEDKDC